MSENNSAPDKAAPSRTIADLRSVLFDTLADLRNKESPMDIDRARAISEVAGRVIESAKVEVEFCKVTGDGGTGFIEAPVDAPKLPPGVTGITRHRLAG